MKKLLATLLLTSLLVCGLTPALAETDPAWNALVDRAMTSIDNLTATGELRVVGTAAVAVDPDMATINLGVQQSHESVMVAQHNTNLIMASIVDALVALGIPEKNMVTSDYSVYPMYDYNNNPPVPNGYQVQNSITVTVEEFSLISTVIDTAVASGANQVNYISFDNSLRSMYYREALSAAIAAAQEKAALMALAAGKQLGELRSVSESEGGMNLYLNAYDARNSMARAGSQILGGQMDVSAQVTLVYGLK